MNDITDSWNSSKEDLGVARNSNKIKLEVRRHNSLTLPLPETERINPGKAAASVSRKGRDDDGVDDETKRIDDSSHKDGNLVVSHSTSATTEQGNQMLFYEP